MSRVVSFGRRLADLAVEAPSRTAFVFAAEDGAEERVTRAELDRRSTQVARLLRERGAGAGDVVVVALRNCPEHFYATYGGWKLGASVLPLRWDLPEWERTRLLQVCAPALVVGEWPGIDPPLVQPREIAQALRNADATPFDYAVPPRSRMIASSGSTGTPKIIATRTEGVFDPDAPPPPLFRAGPQVRQLVTSPLYHTNGFGCHSNLLAGGELVVMQRFDAARTLDLIHRHQANHIVLVPTMLQRIARLDELDPTDLASLDTVFYGGSSLAAGIARRWLELVSPDTFVFQYGGTEGLGATAATGREWLDRPGTVGRPIACDIKITSEDGTPLPPGEVGEIWFRRDGDRPFDYIGTPNPENPDGFYTYGDLGHLDPEGYLYIVDRRTDLIVTGGANVYPAEVELALLEHPDILDAVVIGLPDPEWGHRVHALIEPKPGTTPPTPDHIRNYAKTRLAAYKTPKTIEILDHIPRTSAGKINRTLLVQARTDGLT